MYRLLILICCMFNFLMLSGQHAITSGSNKNSKSNQDKLNFFKKFEKEISHAIPSLGSFIVYQDDTAIYNGYFNNATSQTVFNVKSITKTMVSTLVGIVKQQNLLPDLNTTTLSILKDYAIPRTTNDVWFASEMAHNDSMRATITIKDLVTMQAGFDWDDFGPVANALINSSDPVRLALDVPVIEKPGTHFNYNTGASIILGAVVAKCVKEDLKQFADKNLFLPTGMSLKKWSKDPMGRYLGGSEMYFTAPDLVKFGQMILHRGEVGKTQVVLASWIDEATAEHAALSKWPVLPDANGYGYYWWRRKTNGHQAYIASGYGGQLVYVIPELRIVVVTTCFLNEKNRGREEIRRLHLLIDKVTKFLSMH